jgi:hypothetical protein
MQFVSTTDPRQTRRMGGSSGTPSKQSATPFPLPNAFQLGHPGWDQFMVGSRALQQQPKPQPKPKPGQAHQYQNGQASKWVGAFKVTFSLLVAGGINAFLFGIPVWVAAGVSALVSSAQSIIALKIHREDTEFSRKVVSGSRWLMGRKQDYTPSGKEWSMVPVWGAACGLMALVESMVNHGYKKWFSKDGDKPLSDILKARRTAIDAKLKQSPNEMMKWIYRAQLRGMDLRNRVVDYVDSLLKNWSVGQGWKKKLGEIATKLWNQGGKRSMKTAYLLACGAAILGGIFQTSIAAYMQGKIDRRNGFK